MDLIRVKINCSKIDKALLYRGDKGTYLNCTLIPVKESRYGETHFIVQEVSKEEKERGVKGPIIGNATAVEQSKSGKPAAKPQPAKPTKEDDDDVPF